MCKFGIKKMFAFIYFYFLVMVIYDIMFFFVIIEKEFGEKCVVNYIGVGLFLGEEIDVLDVGEWRKEIVVGEDMDEAK